jgi:glucan biosynthesis protein C
MQTDRLHSLDAVRAFALLLGIVFHATMSFTPTLLSMGWPIADNAPSDTLAATFYFLHIFRMTTFFVMAGFFARLVVHRKGLQSFIQDRKRRILIPLLVAWPAMMVLIGAVFTWVYVKLDLPMTPPPNMPEVFLPFPWTHLWFLYMLLVLYVAWLGVRWFANNVVDRSARLRKVVDAAINKTLAVPIAPLLLALPLTTALFYRDSWRLWEGIPTPDNSIIPNAPALIAYGVAFGFGWFLHRQMQLLNVIVRYWVVYIAVAIGLSWVGYSMVGMPSTAEPIVLDTAERWIYAYVYAAASWCWTLGLTGAAIRFLSNESPTRRYLADASYWMYIMHLPIVFALQALVMDWSWHWSAKYAFILAVTMPLLLVTYHYWVRPTKIGEVLNGRRYSIANVEAASHQLGR